MGKWLIVLILAVCLIIIVAVFLLATGKLSASYQPGMEVFSNPFIGYAPMVGNPLYGKPEQTLAYVGIHWSEWEPEEGQFAVEAIRQQHHLDQLRENGVHVVLRFICDTPRAEAHMDIPQWLYDKLDGDGTTYSNSYGQGFSPNYGNKTLIEAHAKAIAALGEAFGGDTFVSYVQLGSLGHWGEWHVNRESGIRALPGAKVREQYVLPYVQAFPNAKILMRRPFDHAKKHSFGLYNDVTGDQAETDHWLDWIKNGGEFSQTGEANALVPMADAWKTAPVGGEFTSGIPMEELLETQLPRTLLLLRRSHTSFLGPKIAEDTYREGYETVLGTLGYKLRIEEARVVDLFGRSTVILSWTNAGTAPLYWDLPVTLYVEDADGKLVASVPVDLRLSELLPDTRMTTRTPMEQVGNLTKMLKSGSYRLLIGIADPMTGKDCVRLDMDAPYEDGRTVLF